MTDTVLVIRVSGIDLVDPLVEIDNVIAKHGYCWFGKYGRAIPAEKIKPTEENSTVVLVLKGKQRDKERFLSRTYEVSGVSTRRPKDGVYPSYYSSKMSRISIWLKLEKAKKQLTLSSLHTKSSAQPVSTTLSGSMAAFFYCWNVSQQQ